jgi:hypothetical protein
MKAISVWQPWAQFIVMGWKPIEMRLHARFKSLVGQRIAIHAAGKWDNNEESIGHYLSDQQWDEFCLMKKVQPSLAGTVFVESLRPLTSEDSKAALCNCGFPPGPYGLILKDAYRFHKPIPWKGQQGIFDIGDLRI